MPNLDQGMTIRLISSDWRYVIESLRKRIEILSTKEALADDPVAAADAAEDLERLRFIDEFITNSFKNAYNSEPYISEE
jgi:hypothetical protein